MDDGEKERQRKFRLLDKFNNKILQDYLAYKMGEVKTILEPARETPVRMDVDVLVVGAGPAGIIAAQAAASDGLKVALIDNRSFVGGNMTIGLPILGFLGQKR